MAQALLDTDYCTSLNSGKDRNGEIPLHIAAFQCSAELMIALLGNGASLSAKNIYGKGPIDIVSDYSQRKSLVDTLLQHKHKIKHSEIEILKLHQKQFAYQEALSELIYASENKH